MRKIIFISLSIVIALSAFSGCASQKAVAEAKPPAIIGAEGVPQPDWVVTTPKSETQHFETGYAILSNKSNSIKRASAEAKEKISQWINTVVDSVVVNYTSDSGSADDREALEAFESISRQTSNTSLMGVSQESMWVDPEGGVWVLLSMPKENIAKAFETASKEFERSDAAMYAEYKMGQALEMLEETLAKD